MVNLNKTEVFNYLNKVINSCVTEEQLNCAVHWACKTYYNMFPGYDDMHAEEYFIKKREQMHNDFYIKDLINLSIKENIPIKSQTLIALSDIISKCSKDVKEELQTYIVKQNF